VRLDELAPPKGARDERRRAGRGLGSGRGKTSGKGTKGQKARTGGGVPAYFEGGQLPLVRKLPYRRGFNNPFRVEYQVVNLDQINTLEDRAEAGLELFRARGWVKGPRPIKVLARGTLERPVTVHAHKFSAAAREAIMAAGGTAVEIGAPTAAENGVETAAETAAESGVEIGPADDAESDSD
jgi:large subunit ribosomal protein L15